LRAASDALNLPIWIVEKDYYVTRASRTLRDNSIDQIEMEVNYQPEHDPQKGQ
jgi:hypothetical protein